MEGVWPAMGVFIGQNITFQVSFAYFIILDILGTITLKSPKLLLIIHLPMHSNLFSHLSCKSMWFTNKPINSQNIFN